jgi:3-mercaptopyruvate sulfurtransferase SseA
MEESMRFLKDRRRLAVLFAALSLVFVPLFFFGCGGDEYDDPRAEVGSVMVSTAAVNNWVTSGYGADSFGYNKMVVLSVDSQSGYAAGHVPGAYLLDTGVDLSATRSDGIADTVSQVATKAQMDDLIHRTGIDESTVVVITGSGMMTNGRAYYNFRYWGFPRERLRVMNGTKATYQTDGFTLETAVPPAPTLSTYSVCELTQDTTVRASFAETFQVAQDTDPATIVLDSRSANEYNGVAGSTRVSTGKVAFEGHVRTAVNQNFNTLLVGGSNSNPLIPRADIITAMDAIGAGQYTTEYIYCRTSWRATIAFLALDAELGWPAKIYDGAWIEWGQMAGNETEVDGSLDPSSPWLTNSPALSEAITHNKPAGQTVEPLASANSFAPYANLINQNDGAVCGGGGGGGGGGAAPGY